MVARRYSLFFGWIFAFHVRVRSHAQGISISNFVHPSISIPPLLTQNIVDSLDGRVHCANVIAYDVCPRVDGDPGIYLFIFLIIHPKMAFNLPAFRQIENKFSRPHTRVRLSSKSVVTDTHSTQYTHQFLVSRVEMVFAWRSVRASVVSLHRTIGWKATTTKCGEWNAE